MSDDLTIAYMMGVEDMRSRMHKQADDIERLRAENEKLREELEMIRKACRKACKANYKLGIDKGKEKAIIRMREMGE